MFQELMPILADRALTITVAAIAGGKLKVCVIPQSLDKDGKVNEKIGYQAQKEVVKIPESAIKALTTPLALTGTPEELDAELPGKLATYVAAHTQLQHGIEQATREITDAVKALDERNKSKAKAKAVPPSYTGKDEDRQDEKSDPPAAVNETLPLAWCTPAPTPTATNKKEESCQ